MLKGSLKKKTTHQLHSQLSLFLTVKKSDQFFFFPYESKYKMSMFVNLPL
jgi:hypothetical protein